LAGVVITVPYGGAQRDLYVASSGEVAGGINDKTVEGETLYNVSPRYNKKR